MKRQIKWYVSGLTILLVALAVVVEDSTNIRSAVVGALVFSLNTALLAFVSRRLFGGQTRLPDQNGHGAGTVLLALAGKVFGLGIIVYVSLVTWQLPAIFFVSGAVCALVSVVIAMLVRSPSRSASIDRVVEIG